MAELTLIKRGGIPNRLVDYLIVQKKDLYVVTYIQRTTVQSKREVTFPVAVFMDKDHLNCTVINIGKNINFSNKV